MMASYELSHHALRACRAANRLIADKSITDEQWNAETAFDSGEWSEAALCDMHVQMEHDTISYVAIRFGYMPSQLAHFVMYYDSTQSDMWFKSFPSLGEYK